MIYVGFILTGLYRLFRSAVYLGDVGGLGLGRLGQRWADRPISDQREAPCQLAGLPRGQQTDGNGNEPTESSF